MIWLWIIIVVVGGVQGSPFAPCHFDHQCHGVNGEVCCDYYTLGKPDVTIGDYPPPTVTQAIRWPLLCLANTTCRRHWCECDNDCVSSICCEGRCTTPFDVPLEPQLNVCANDSQCLVAPLIRCCSGVCTDRLDIECPNELCESLSTLRDGCITKEAYDYATIVLPACFSEISIRPESGKSDADPYDFCPTATDENTASSLSSIVVPFIFFIFVVNM